MNSLVASIGRSHRWGMETLLIAVAVLATSTLSGVLGMGGGMILMGIFLWLLPVEWAMILHGCTQLMSNGSRAWLHRGEVRWHFLPRYLVGAALAYAALSWLAWAPSKGLAFLALGSLPLIARLPWLARGLDINRPGMSLLCGVTVFSAQVVAGASGPALDVFFLSGGLTRYQIIATKALTQTLSHAMKILYFSAILTAAGGERPFDLWLVPLLVAIPPVGSWLGKHLLGGVSDAGFLRWTRAAATGIGAVWLVRGLYLLWVE